MAVAAKLRRGRLCVSMGSMESGRTKPDKDVFLGTADIIAQVKLAQGRAAWRWFGAIRLYLLALGSIVLGLFILSSYWRALPIHRRTGAPPVAPVAAAEPSAAPGLPTQAPAAPPAGQEAAPSAKPLAIKVTLTHQSGAMWIDGTKVADKKRVWSGHLPPGNHQLAVRVGGHMMRHTFVVENEPLHVTLDPVRQTFVVSSSGRGHRSMRLRGF